MAEVAHYYPMDVTGRTQITREQFEARQRAARQRWQANRANPTRRDVTDADFEAIVRAWEAPLEDEQALVLPFDEPIERWIEAHADIFVEVS